MNGETKIIHVKILFHDAYLFERQNVNTSTEKEEKCACNESNNKKTTCEARVILCQMFYILKFWFLTM